MSLIENISTLSYEQIEAIEKLTVRWIFQAMLDFGMEAHNVFLQSPDEVKDVAEDITREVLDRLAGYNVPQRIYGTVDYKKARYIILPENTVKQALFVDSKAEKQKGNVTIQMSQISMSVRQFRAGNVVQESGFLSPISIYNNKQYLTTTAFVHFMYEDIEERHNLREVTVCCVPNGILQDLYNPNENDTIWIAGRNAPTRGEDFRVRLSFERLRMKTAWRVQKILFI